MAAKFQLGKIAATPGAMQALADAGQLDSLFLSRHVQGDFGNMDAEDQAVNNEAIEHGARIMSSYQTLKNVTVWIITEADRSVTTILLPDEY